MSTHAAFLLLFVLGIFLMAAALFTGTPALAFPAVVLLPFSLGIASVS